MRLTHCLHADIFPRTEISALIIYEPVSVSIADCIPAFNNAINGCKGDLSAKLKGFQISMVQDESVSG
jgi:hypothetical protein